MAKNDRQVRDVMTPDPVTVSEGDTVREAARIMAREDTGVGRSSRERKSSA